MARRWVNLVGVTPLLLGIMISAPQMVMAPLVLAQNSQTNQSSRSSQQTEAQRLYEEGEQLRQQVIWEPLERQGTKESLEQALAKFQQALPLFRADGDRNGEAGTLDSIGRVYNNLEQLQLALNYLQQALTIWREVGDRSGEARTLNNIGRVYLNLWQGQQALNVYQQALAIFREVGNSTEERLSRRSEEADILNNIGLIYIYMIQQPQQALNFYQQELAIRRELGDRVGEAKTLHGIGEFYSFIDQLQQALNHFQQALAIYREASDSTEERLRRRRGEAITLRNLGGEYNRIGQPQQALSFYQQALSIWREMGIRSAETSLLNSIGDIYKDMGQPQQALTYFEQALTISREVRDSTQERRSQRYGEADALENIGDVYRVNLEQPQEALTYYQQALTINRELGSRFGEAGSLSRIGYVYKNIGQPQQALTYFQQALSIWREEGERYGQASSLVDIGSVYKDIGQPQQAFNFYQQALTTLREVGNRSIETGILSRLASLQQTLNDLPAALQSIQAAIAIVEDIRGQLTDPDSRTSYFATVQEYYKLEVELLMQLHQQNPSQGYNSQAFNVTERSKARTLLELLTESRADIRTGVDPQLLQQEQNLQTQLAALDKRRIDLANSITNNNKDQIAEQITALETQRAALQTQFRDLQTQIRATSPKYAALKYPQPLTLEQIQQQILDDNTLILSYSLGEDRSYLWLISKTEMTSYQLPSQKIIEDLVNKKARPQFTTRFTSRNGLLIDTSEVSNVLLKLVLEKIGNKRIVIISDGALQFLPFGALPDPRVSDRYQPLLVNNEINYLPSASTLQTLRTETQNRIPAPRSIAILADPVFAANDPRVDHGAATPTTPNELSLAAQNLATATRSARGGDWSRIPHTRQEAETILKLFPLDRSLSFLDFNANRTNAQSDQLSQYRFIHWATHGFVNTEKPELSGVVMSLVQENGQPQDGYLLLGDIFNLNFNADLVVLSACETGLGEIVQGEGLIGLTRGLMYAGTSRVVTSLWAVPDEQTAILMGKFYEKMLQQNLPPAEALRAAQLEIFQSRSKWAPYYWAAFTLQGEWR